MTMNNPDLLSRLVLHEGIVPHAYKDSKGYLTIGCGRMIDQTMGGKLYPDEIMFLLNNDLNRCAKLLAPYSWFYTQNTVRQGVLIELCFNMGIGNLLKFKNMIAALKLFNFSLAVKELQDSKWATDVSPDRVKDLSSRLLEGAY